MKERFKGVNLDGSIRIKLSDEKGYWQTDKRRIMSAIVDVCEEYLENGYTLTLRQLYYQLVSKDFIPNHDKVYKKLSSLKDELVYAGVVDWSVFEDRGRVASTPYYEESVSQALDYTARTYRVDRQKNQGVKAEVWTEKDAISGILKRVTVPFGITLVVNKGYTSSTAIYSAYRRFKNEIGEGKKVVILYFGDHDPSGLDMVRDIRERLMFMFVNGQLDETGDAFEVDWNDDPVYFEEIIDNWAMNDDETDYTHECDNYYHDEDCMSVHEDDGNEFFDIRKAFFKHHFQIQQIGLTMEQIKEYNPPPNPAKITDPRAKEYVSRFGQVSWEVDALRPKVMEQIVKDAIEREIDMDIYNNVLKEEQRDRTLIKSLVKNIDENND